MKPKTELRYSRVYNKLFNEKFSRDNFIKLKQDCEKFEKLYNKYIHQILRLIEKYHKKEWSHQFIPIYIVKDSPNCFSDPLTLKYYENEKMMLVLLAHELLHNNFAGKWKFENPEELHKYMEPILNKVILELDVDLKKELEIMNKKTMELARRNSK